MALKYGELAENLRKWHHDILNHHAAFSKQVDALRKRDLELVENVERIKTLNDEVTAVERQQTILDKQLGAISNEQSDISAVLDDLESKVSEEAPNGSTDHERNRMTDMAERVFDNLTRIQNNLDNLSQDFKQGSQADLEDPMKGITETLQYHLEAITSLKANIDDLQSRIQRVSGRDDEYFAM
eukprot:gene6000-9126_t